ncbi:MAG: class I SAM-dependent methyltransferase [Oligoflexia bacterium]|nr:class I SAM-dependent methyltransferase [Oligoflexia bacterium]
MNKNNLEKDTLQYKRGGLQKDTYHMSDTSTWSCPLCKDESSSKHHDQLLKTERGALGVVKCKKCSLIRINPRLTNPDAVYHGKEKDYLEEFRLIIDGKKEHHRDRNYLEDLNTIAKYKPDQNPAEFLDIGTNTGSFLRLARNRKWNLTGVEPSKSLSNLAQEWWGLNIINSFLEDAKLPTLHYDIVTMTDVFEHIVNPNELLQEVHRIMKKDGILFIKVPNGKYNVFKYNVRKKLLGRGGSGSDATSDDFDAYEHVCHYTDKTLTKMLRKNNFKILETKIALPVQIPMWHKYVGQYYQYKQPFFLDWKGQIGRTSLYHASKIERLIRGGSIGHLAPNIICIARPT